MPTFPKPTFAYTYNVQAEINALRQHKAARGIPAKQADRFLIATWNIANFGAQQRRDSDHALIAEVLSWFDLVAVQEVRDNYGGLEDVRRKIGGSYAILMSDVAGNSERMTFLYDASKVKPLELVAEIAIPPTQHKAIKLPGITRAFQPFDRNPYLAAFEVGHLSFTMVTVHLFYGSEKQADMERRALETFAVARWAALEETSPFCYTRDIIVLGDFNMPKADPTDPIYKALTKKGLHVPQHSGQIASAIASDSNYDQMAFFPGATAADFTNNHGVFDFDQVIFATLYQARPMKDFLAYCRYYLSDHRPMWMEFKTTQV